MSIKLKRCPFCNANAKYSYKEWRKKENLFLFNTELYCEKCGATPISTAKEVSYKYDSNTGDENPYYVLDREEYFDIDSL